jgi:hypothetical protein
MNEAIKLGLAIAGVGALLAPAAAQAADQETTFRILAVVQPFCRITVASGENGAEAVNGRADFGPVRELCNTPGGYVVRAQFRNLNQGSLVAGESRLPIAADGSVEFTSEMARLRVRNWSVVDLAEQTDQRVYLRVSISPL